MIADKLSEIRNLLKENDFNDLENAEDEKKLLYLYGLYHYYFGDPDCIPDVQDHIKYTGKYGNIIQACFEPDSYEDKIIDVIVTCSKNDFSYPKVQQLFASAQNLIGEIKNKKFSATGNESILKDYIDSTSTEKISIKVLTDYEPEYEEKNRLLDKVESFTSLYEYVKFELIFGNDVEDEITQLTSDKKCVERSTIKMTSENNYLFYGDEKSFICNVSAFSIKENYRKYGKSGLFAMNLRFYISDKKVDPGLTNSIKNKSENFWYYNNGIIIVCDDYKFVGDKIELENFSIVNGGQTTRMIGEIPFANDFAISCKVIKNKYKDDKEANARFVSEVAEASNTQKPINSTDIIANKPEQRLLKENLSNDGIFVQIKRGDAAAANIKVNYPEPWQKTKNNEIGQLIYSGIYQKPGTARNSKDKIFSDKKKYNLVFDKYNENKYKNVLIKDILFIRACYKKWMSSVSKDPSLSSEKVGLVKNGLFFTEASILLIAKFYYSKHLVNYASKNGINEDKVVYAVSQRTFNHRIFNDEYDNICSKLTDLFEWIYSRIISRAFEECRGTKPDLAYSNFTKIDKNYQLFVMRKISDTFTEGNSLNLMSKLESLFYKETDDDKTLTEYLVNESIESFGKVKEEEDDSTDELDVELDENLREFRTRKYKELGITAYSVFTNAELKLLVQMKPRNLNDLKNFGCFKNKPKTKTRFYGSEIVNIIDRTCRKDFNRLNSGTERYYLAYGSNLQLSQMKNRCPNFERVGSTFLNGYKLEFNKYLTIVPDSNSSVPVGIYKLTTEDEENLNRYEDYPTTYRKEDMFVVFNGKQIKAFTYIMNNIPDRMGVAPAEEYINRCLDGYNDFGFNPEFIYNAIKER